MYKEKHLSLISLVTIYSAFLPSSPAFCYIPSLSSISPTITALFYLPHPHLCIPEFSLAPSYVLSSSSQLVPFAPVLQFGLQYVRVLGLKAQLLLLLSFPRLGSVPVGFDCLVVPDHRRLRVADIAEVSCVMGWINQKRLCRKGAQVSTFKVVHVL